MKEIGEALKEARERIGISIEEAANDLKLKPSQIEDIEAGNKDAFKDIFYLKYFIRDYSKYLGLNYEDMVDDFNEFLFDYTSKLSLDDIKKAKNKVDNKTRKLEKRVVSPYTYEKKKRINIFPILLYLLIIILIIGIGLFAINQIDNKEEPKPVENVIK